MQITFNTPLSELVQYGTPEQLFEHRLTILDAIEKWAAVEIVMEDACINDVDQLERHLDTHTNDDDEYKELEDRVDELEERNSNLSSEIDYLKEQIEEYREKLAEVEVE